MVYHHFIHPVRHFIDQLVKDQQAAEDIAVEAFTRTFKKNTDFATIDKLKGFLFITAGNAAKDFLRSQKRQREAYEEVKYLKEQEEEDFELAYIRTEAARAVRDAIDEVPGQAGQVVRMVFVEGKSLSQVAAELQIAYNTVQNHRARGLQLIREKLKTNQLLSTASLLLAFAYLDYH